MGMRLCTVRELTPLRARRPVLGSHAGGGRICGEDRFLRQARESLRKNTVIGKFRLVISPAYLEHPSAFPRLQPQPADLSHGNHNQWVKIAVERPNVLRRDEKSR